VLRSEPDWTALPPEVPSALRALLRRCLEKDRRERVADISTALFVLKEQASLTAPVGPASAAPSPRRPLWRRVAAVTLVASVAAAVTGAAVWVATRPAPPTQSSVRFQIPASGNTTAEMFRLSPDGRSWFSWRLTTVLNRMYVRSLDSLDAKVPARDRRCHLPLLVT
jgi:hypothetical protein